MTLRREALDILYVGELPPHPGGSATMGAQLLAGLAGLGHAVRALAPITAQALASGDRFAARHPEIDIARFDVPRFEVAPAVAVPDESLGCQGDRIGERLPGLVAEHHPDVIVIGRATFAWHVPDFAASRSIPSVLLIHGLTAHAILSAPDEARAQRLVDRFRNIDLAVFVAEHLAGHAEQLGLRNFTIIPNGVDLQAFSPRPKDTALLRRFGLQDGNTVIVHASNLAEVKRPLDILDSAEQVLRERPEVVYLIVGDGPCRAAMAERCRQRGILDSVRFVGWVDHECVAAYLNLADVVVMPSEIEALALVYLETQACGRLLLASDIPAAREVIRDGQTGLLFRKGDVDDLAARTLRAAGDAELRATIGGQARAWVSAHHDLDRTVAAYEEVLRRVAGRRHRDVHA